jgi:hypothetical protein
MNIDIAAADDEEQRRGRYQLGVSTAGRRCPHFFV